MSRRYRDLEVKKIPNNCEVDRFIVLDMKDKTIGDNTFIGMVYQYCKDHEFSTNKAPDAFKYLLGLHCLVVVKNIRNMSFDSLRDPGLIMLFATECVRDLPENWGLTIEACI